MELQIEEKQNAAIVQIPGEKLDASNVAALKQAMEPVIENHDNVILDLSELTFVDSSALGAILAFTRQLTGKGGELKLCSLQKPVRTLVELVRLHRVLDIFNTCEEAENSL